MTPQAKCTLARNVAVIAQMTGDSCIDVTTGCSGSEVIYQSLDILTEFLDNELASKIDFGREFGAELLAWKRKFIVAHGAPRVLFENVDELSSGIGTDTSTGKTAKVSRTFLTAWGPECDSISNLNKDANVNRSCVQDGTGKTGTTLQAF